MLRVDVASLIALAGCRSILGLDSGSDGTADGDASSEGSANPSGNADGSNMVLGDSSTQQADGAKPDGSGGGVTDASTIDQWTPDANRNVDRAWAAWPLPVVSPPAANYAVTADTVLDRTTFLVWERNPNPTKRLWQDAMDYCDTLTLAGQTDWRLREAHRALVHPRLRHTRAGDQWRRVPRHAGGLLLELVARRAELDDEPHIQGVGRVVRRWHRGSRSLRDVHAPRALREGRLTCDEPA